ncbi:acetyltransferase, fucose-4-O-acetylase [Glaciecola sp. KUL10]|nr:acetyltransferase, fucose-4-O-acetylase [Glaciecola sp. KUL10]
MSSKTDWVDYAKALGIILVVYGHTARGVFNAGLDMNNELFKLIDSVIYTFHMPLFFFYRAYFLSIHYPKGGLDT